MWANHTVSVAAFKKLNGAGEKHTIIMIGFTLWSQNPGELLELPKDPGTIRWQSLNTGFYIPHFFNVWYSHYLSLSTEDLLISLRKQKTLKRTSTCTSTKYTKLLISINCSFPFSMEGLTAGGSVLSRTLDLIPCCQGFLSKVTCLSASSIFLSGLNLYQ